MSENLAKRIVLPPLSELDRLRTPLTPGEVTFLRFLWRNLPPAWEIYIQPHLNGLRPDFVLLHPDVGIAVFEVKDWSLDAMRYFVHQPTGSPPRLMAEKDNIRFSLQHDNPIEKIQLYKEEVHNLYCPRTAGKAGYAIITAGVIFPYAETARVLELLNPFRRGFSMDQTPQYYPVAGKELLQSSDITKVFPEAHRKASKYMSDETAADLRNWLVEPEVSSEQRQPLELNSDQKNLVTSRTNTGYRKIKGPAGSGKSLVLAARAAQLSSEGKSVLVVSYNITLLNYLMDLAVRWPNGRGRTREQVTWLNFHNWCKRVCYETGHREEYKALWHGLDDELELDSRRGPLNNPSVEGILSVDMPELVDAVLSGPEGRHATKFDAILVDEGQDLLLEWWNCLRKVLKSGGEMVLVADTTQDIYETAQYWTDEKMAGSGLVGAWNALSISYRLPDQMIIRASQFAIAAKFGWISFKPYVIR